MKVEAIPDSNLLSESEALYLNLLEMSFFPITITTLKEGRYLIVNSAFYKMTGLEKKDVIGRTSIELGILSDPEDRKTIRDALERDGEIKDFQCRTNHEGLLPTQTSIWVKKIRFQNQDCALTKVQPLVPAIEAQRDLRPNDKRLHPHLGNIKESYYEMDREGNFSFLNDPLIKLLGSSANALKDKNIKSFINDQDVAKLNQIFIAIDTGQSDIEFFEFRLKREDGNQLYVEASISSFSGPDG